MVEATKFSAIPIVKIETHDGKGLYEDHLATIDRINFTLFSRIVITDKQSFKELWIKGLPLFFPDPDTGELVKIDWSEQTLQGPGTATLLPGTETDIVETGATDFTQLTSAVFSDIKHLAALTSTPLYILDPSSAQQSALGADLADKVHRTKVRTLRTSIGAGLSELMGLSFEATGTGGRIFEPVWAALDDESMSIRAQTAAMLTSMLPLKMIWTDILQMTPEQVEEAELLLEEAQANRLLITPGGIGSTVTDMTGQSTGDEIESLYQPDNQPEDAQSFETDTTFFTGVSEKAQTGSPTEPASNFVLLYLEQNGNEAPASDVIEAGKIRGYTEQAIKTARSRMSDQVVYTRKKGPNGKLVNYWQKIR